MGMEATMSNDTMTLTAEEEQAIREYAAREGRRWKSELNLAWYNASEPGILQSLRNSHGPEWLRSYRLAKK
jgi:hypothetical protein